MTNGTYPALESLPSLESNGTFPLLCKNLKLPSRQPSVVCENCLYSLRADRRARAFHILDPKCIIEMLLIFLEEKGDGSPSLCDNSMDMTNRISPFLGKWKGQSSTKRSGIYGSKITQAEIVVSLEMDDSGQLIQVCHTLISE